MSKAHVSVPGLVLSGVISCLAQSPVVPLAKPDSDGWIRLYDGSNAGHFYTDYGGGRKGTFPDQVFLKGGGDTLRVNPTQTGLVIHKQPFTHYRAKFQYHYPDNRQGNSGFLFHIQPDDPYYQGIFPRSLESQGDPGQGMSQLWCIGNVWVTIRLRPGTGPGGYFGNVPIYDPTRPESVYGNENQEGKRAAAGIEGWAMPKLTAALNNQWTEMEVDVHGNDSITHKLNGKTMIRYREPRVALTSDPAKVAGMVTKRLTTGLLGWQSEGVPILYRNLMVKLHPEDPLYNKFYGPVTTRSRERGDIRLSTSPRNRLHITGMGGRADKVEGRDVRGAAVPKF